MPYKYKGIYLYCQEKYFKLLINNFYDLENQKIFIFNKEWRSKTPILSTPVGQVNKAIGAW
jgi:hypothetical protein